MGADVIAVLSLMGTLAVHEYLAGALIGVMLATGQALESAAERRAAKDLRSLLERAPRVARRRMGDCLETVPLDEVAVGDRVVVGPGEMLPVDAVAALRVGAVLDESVLTGRVRSCRLPGAVQAVAQWRGQCRSRRGDPRNGNAAESTYAGIVRLAEQAAAESAPVVRLADRVAAWFCRWRWALPDSLGCSAESARACGGGVGGGHAMPAAAGGTGGDCGRVVAGIAIRCRRQGRRALENLGRATTLVLDKTGTVTTGRPRGTDVLVGPGLDAAGGPAARGVGRPGLAARDGQSHRRARQCRATASAEHAQRCGRGGREGSDRDRRRQVRHGGEPRVPTGCPQWATAAETRADSTVLWLPG